MATNTLHLTVKTRFASIALRVLLPLAWLGLIYSDRAASIVMRFIRVKVA